VFEEQVAARLAALGYDVKMQIGTAGFFVDLAISDPDKPGRFVLGIECDGAQYHSSRSARDRDRLRQNVLEAHGWIIHRIWSTDWFLRPNEELVKVRTAIDAAKARWRELEEEATNPRAAVPLRFKSHEDGDVDVVTGYVTTDVEESISMAYEEAKLVVRQQVEPHETPLADMAKHVARIVEIEGPIHESEIVVRIRSAWGLARAGNRIRDAVQSAIDAAKRKGTIIGGPFYSLPGQDVSVRSRANVASPSLRKPECLPPEEIKAAIVTIVGKNFGAEREQLILAVARALGFASTSSQLRSVIEAAIGELIEGKKLNMDGSLLAPL
jgi:very-short-patch-repair endonuclease